MRKILVLSLTLCVVCTFINMALAHPSLNDDSKRQAFSCRKMPCFSDNDCLNNSLSICNRK